MNDIKTQAEMLSLGLNVLEYAQVYQKTKTVYARKVVKSELVETHTSDGLETTNIAEVGDYIIENDTEAQERYVISDLKFKSRYTPLDVTNESTWGIYQAIGQIQAIELTDEVLLKLGISEDIFYFVAPWQENMIAKKGDFLGIPMDNDEIYRLARKEFFETYELKEESNA